MNLRPLLLLSVLAAPPARAQVDATTMRAHFIDVGQGAATLLEFSCGVVLIDTGGEDAAAVDHLVTYLQGVFAARPELHDTVDAVYISHNHVDHTRGLRRVVEQFHVRRVIENHKRGGPSDQGDATLRWLDGNAAAHGVQHLDVDDDEVVQSQVGLSGPDLDPLACGGPSVNDPEIRILAADRADRPTDWNTDDFGDKNNHSVVVRVDFGRASFLFSGDMETRALGALVDRYAGTALLDVDVWQVGHHGSDNGTTTGFLDAVARPAVAVIAMGRCDVHGMWTAWGHGHPRKSAVDRLRSAILRRRSQSRRVQVADGQHSFTATLLRDALYGTGWDGTIVVRATAEGTYRVTTERSSAPQTC